MGIAQFTLHPRVVAAHRGKHYRPCLSLPSLLHKQAQILFIGGDVGVALGFVDGGIVVAKLYQYPITRLQVAINFIPAPLFKKSPCAAPAARFIRHKQLFCTKELLALRHWQHIKLRLQRLAPAGDRVALGLIVFIQGVVSGGGIRGDINSATTGLGQLTATAHD